MDIFDQYEYKLFSVFILIKINRNSFPLCVAITPYIFSFIDWKYLCNMYYVSSIRVQWMFPYNICVKYVLLIWVNAIYSPHRQMYYILYADYTKLLFEYTSFIKFWIFLYPWVLAISTLSFLTLGFLLVSKQNEGSYVCWRGWYSPAQFSKAHLHWYGHKQQLWVFKPCY